MSSEMCVHVCVYKHWRSTWVTVPAVIITRGINDLFLHVEFWMWALLTVRGYKCQVSAAWRRQQFAHQGRVLMYCQRSNNSLAHINSTLIRQASESAKLLSSSETLERSQEGFTANPCVTTLPLTAHRPASPFWKSLILAAVLLKYSFNQYLTLCFISRLSQYTMLKTLINMEHTHSYTWLFSITTSLSAQAWAQLQQHQSWYRVMDFNSLL